MRKLIGGIGFVSLTGLLLWFASRGGAHLFQAESPVSRSAARSTLCHFGVSGHQRLLIIVPHPDDEALACGGLVQRALAAGAAVRLIFVTNGDGFRHAVEQEYRTLATAPEDFLEFGRQRMVEARRSAATLGLSRHDVGFVGFPDGGLTRMWRDHWWPQRPLRSRYTAVDRVPYGGTLRFMASYCGSELVDILEGEISAFRPTDVFTTHPADDHPDHAALYAFVMTALHRAQHSGAFSPEGCHHHLFLVHRGNWPRPQGRYLERRLDPPQEMLGLETRWAELPLNDREVARKVAAITCHETQMEIMGRFLISFARQNELFASLPLPVLRFRPDPSRSEGVSASPVILQDPAGDNIVRRLRPGADLRSVTVAVVADRVRVSVETGSRPPVTTACRVHIRGVEEDGSSTAAEVLTWGLTRGQTSLPLQRTETGFEGYVPLPRLQKADLLFVDVETKTAGFTVDRTGPRLILVRRRER